jgi:type II secretory pathway component PulK
VGTSERRGMVLVLVLVVIAVLTLGGFTFTELMLAERKAAVLAAAQAQARASADSGMELIRMMVSKDRDSLTQLGGLYDNEPAFRGRLVLDGPYPHQRSRFAIIAPRVDQGTVAGIRFGLEDESTRLNLNTLMLAEKTVPGSAKSILLGLPGMTDEAADSILDWIDEDDEAREFGAEVDYYSTLPMPYAPKNGPLETVEELLLVKGVTPGLLLGSDSNRNGLLDGSEPTPDALGIDDPDGSMTRGWAGYLTLWSLESNLRPDGKPRVNVNQSDMNKLYNELMEALGNDEWADYIVAYRQTGPSTSTAEGVTMMPGPPDLNKKGKTKLTQILDLIGSRVEVQVPGEKQKTVVDSPFVYTPNVSGVMNTYLPILMDNLTTSTKTVIPGRINVNQAPRVVLAGIPGMTDTILEAILSDRSPDPAQADPERRHETWLLANGIVTLEEMKAMQPFICGGGSVYRAQVVGYFEKNGPAARIEVVIDATVKPPKVVFWRDLSHLGRGYAVETLGMGSDW